MQDTYEGHLQHLPQISFLARGWLGFTTHSKEDTAWIMQDFWDIEGSPLYLQRWTPLFNDQMTIVDYELVWVRLPHLPLNLWHPRILEAIGNYLGVFHKVDLSFLQIGRRMVARILVGLQIYKGLADRLPIQYSCGTHVQSVDYEGLPFRCHRCHKWGHLVAECIKGTRAYSHAPRVTHSCEACLLSGEEGRRRSPIEVSSGNSRAEREEEGRSLGVGPISAQPQSAQSPSTSHFEDVASSGMIFSLVTCSFSPALSHVVSAFSCISLDASSIPPTIKPAAALVAIPCPMSEPSLLVAVKEFLSSSKESLVRYNLWNRSIHVRVDKNGMGLGLMSLAMSQKKRGRKSLLSMAKDRASLDVAVGRQTSIIWALRANDTQDGLRP